MLMPTLVSFFKFACHRFSFLIFLLICLLLARCTVPIDIFDFGDPERKLVVDGYITDLFKSHQIRLSYSSTFNGDGVFIEVTEDNARVYVEDDLGNRIEFGFVSKGIYKSPEFRADLDRSYKVIVEVESESFISNSKSLPQNVVPIEISFQESTKQVLSTSGENISEFQGVSVKAKIDPSNDHVFYQWIQEEHYIYEAIDFPGGRTYNAREQDSVFIDIQATNANPIIFEWWYRLCFVQELNITQNPQVNIFEKKPNQTNGSLDIEINFIECSAKLEHDFAIRTKQLILDREAYEYWNAIKGSIESVGSIFDPTPYSIQGNITGLNGSATLGFFGVYRENSQNVFFNNDVLTNCNQMNPNVCPGDHGIATDPCLDCEKAQGESNSKDKPDWWR